MPALQRAILSTLAYADIFDYPLTQKECYFYLISKTSFSSNKFQQTLFQLIKNKKIEYAGGFYFLPGRKRLVLQRNKKSQFAKKKLVLAKHVAGVIGFISSVRLVGITGALSMQNTPQDDDVDLVVVTVNGTMWVTRFLVTLLISIMGKRRLPQQQQVGDKICLNMYIDESALDMRPHDLFIAHEVAQMVPVVDKGETYQKFMTANVWVKKFLPHAFGEKAKNLNGKEKQISQWFLPFILNALRFLETPAKVFQLWYMHSRKTTEKITDHQLRFHPQDIRHWVLTYYQNRIGKLIKPQQSSYKL